MTVVELLLLAALLELLLVVAACACACALLLFVAKTAVAVGDVTERIPKTKPIKMESPMLIPNSTAMLKSESCEKLL